MNISSYSKIYNLGHAALISLFNEPVVVEEKIDGSQFSFCIIGGELLCKSKNTKQNIESPGNMFNKAINTVVAIKDLLVEGRIYRAEYLQKPKHNALEYDRIPKNHLIIFDIDEGGGNNYLSYDEKYKEAERIGLECVPLLYCGMLKNASDVESLLETDSILGGQKVEGIVIKNYQRFDITGHTLMGKYVSEKFKEKHNKSWKSQNPNKKDILQLIGEAYKTEARWDKAIQHLRDSGKLTYTPKDIPLIIAEFHQDIKDECGQEIKEELFAWSWRSIARIITYGLPEYYKKYLLEQQFIKEA